MNSGTLAGNKIKKLEFLAADALVNNHDRLVSWGSSNSNHCRTTSGVASFLGMKCSLFQDCDFGAEKTSEKEKEFQLSGNMRLSKLAGADLFCVPKDKGSNNHLLELAKNHISDRKTNHQENPYLITVGASQSFGLFGFINLTLNMVNQESFIKNEITDIFVGSGTVGTVLGIALGIYFLFKDPMVTRIYATESVSLWFDR